MKGKGVGRLISTFTHLCNSARDTSSASPSCSLLSGRISTLKDETGAVSRARSKVGWPVGGRTGLPTHSRLPCSPHADLHRQGPHRLCPHPQLPADQRVRPQVGMGKGVRSPIMKVSPPSRSVCPCVPFDSNYSVLIMFYTPLQICAHMFVL